MLTVCRLCLENDANFSIFSANVVSLRIMTCTSLEVEPDDGLPSHICSNCRLLLEEFHTFRKRCLAADRRLRLQKQQQMLGLACNLELEKSAAREKSCAATENSVKSENWRKKAVELIRNEIDEYKKDLMNICKQQVREEIEQQVRNEVQELIVIETKKQCQLNVLDELFYELENFFIRKRLKIENNGLDSESILSSSEAVEQVSASTLVDVNAAHTELAEVVNSTENDGDVSVVDLIGDELNQSINMKPDVLGPNSSATLLPTNIPSGASEQSGLVAMVEINMQDSQMQHLRDDYSNANFLYPPHKQKKKTTELLNLVGVEKPKSIPNRRKSQFQERDVLCRKQACKKRILPCRLRSTHCVPESAS